VVGRGRRATLVLGAMLASVAVGGLVALAVLGRSGQSTLSPVAIAQCPRPVDPAMSSPGGSSVAYVPSFPVQLSPRALAGLRCADSACASRVSPVERPDRRIGPIRLPLVAWWSGADYDDTVTFYGGLNDQRWHMSGSSTTPQAAVFTLSDSAGIFSDALVEVDRTDPVRIGVSLRPPGIVAAPSVLPGRRSVSAHGLLPPPRPGFPVEFLPGGTKLC